MNTHATSAPQRPLPWWRFGMAWLAFGLPASAVVAATLSAVIAVRHADPVLDTRHEQQASGITATSPAELARNHASIRR